MITQQIKLNLIPGQVLPRFNVSQYDKDSRTLQFRLYDGDQAFTIPTGMTAQITGTKPDNKGFVYTVASATAGDNLIIADLEQQMTAVAGEVKCELVLKQNAQRLGTCNFIIFVEKAAFTDDTDISETELPEIIEEATAQMEAAAQSASEAASSAQSAAESASSASTSATNAASSATSAANSATSAANSASSASDSATSAEESAERAELYSTNTPYIGANGNWWVWNTTQGAYVDTGVDASITVTIADITMLEPSEQPRVTNSGTNTDPVFHLFIPRGKGISSITKTSTSGLIDTYTITYSDGATTTFTVTNGKTAYQSAVEGGYSGTEAEFESDLAHFEEWKDDAEAAAQNAADSETNSAQSALDAANSASLAEQYADFVTPHFIIQNNRLYIKDDAVGEFTVANNRLYIKLAS